MPKKVYIIHKWGGSSTGDWIPWLKEELEAKGIDAVAPDMPDSERPTVEEWTGFISSAVMSPYEDTYFVGHSISCQAIIRYLSALPENTLCGGAVLVSPWIKASNLNDDETAIARPWMESPIDFDRAKLHARKFTVIYSNNDAFVPEANATSFGSSLNAKLVMDENKGHFSDDDDVTQLPSALNELLDIMK